MSRATFIFLLLCCSAHAQDPTLRYATFPDLATARSLTAQGWQTIQCQPQPACDAAQITKYLYPVIGLTDGRYAIVIRSGDVFQGEIVTVNGRTFALTAGQIAALSTRAQMGTLLGDIIPIAVANSRITAPQLSAINTYNNTHAAAKTRWNLLISGPIDLQGTLIWTAMTEYQTAGILTAEDVQKITLPVSTVSVTP